MERAELKMQRAELKCLTLAFAMVIAFAARTDAHNKTIAESILITLMPDRIVRIHAPWENYVAYDRGVESVWVGTPKEFEVQRRQGFDAPVRPTANSDIHVVVADVPLSHIFINVMYGVDAVATQRPHLPSGMSYVAMEWQPPVSPNPLIFLVDLQTGFVARSYFSGTTEDIGTEEFLFPARSIGHRTMLVLFGSQGKPSAIAVRSIAWLTVRDYESGQDVWELEAHRLVEQDNALRFSYREADMDLKRFNQQLRLSADAPVTVTPEPIPTH